MRSLPLVGSILEDWGASFRNLGDGALQIKGLGEHNLEDLLHINRVRCRAKDQWGLHCSRKLARLDSWLLVFLWGGMFFSLSGGSTQRVLVG